MCDPVTVTAISGGAQAIGTGASIYSNIRAANYQKAMAEQNAKLAREQASRVRGFGLQKAADIKALGAQAASSAEAALAAGNIETTTGSAANIQTASIVAAEQDAEQVKVNAAMQAWGLEQEAESRIYQAEQQRKATILGSIGQGIGAAGAIAGSSYKMLNK